MSPAFISLFLLALSIPIMIVNFLLPTMNLHLATNREALLKASVQQIVDNNRLAPNNIAPLIEGLDVDGISITSVNVAVSANGDGRYINVDLKYRFNKLFLNHFFTSEDLKKDKTMTMIIDRVI